MRSKSFLAAAVVAALTAAPAFADVVPLHGTFRDEHGATNSAEGEVKASLDTTANTLTFHLWDRHLSGPITVAHLHGPAEPDVDGPVIAPITPPYGHKIHGVLHLTPDQVKQVQAGKTYINLHTARYPAGEVRAQLTSD